MINKIIFRKIRPIFDIEVRKSDIFLIFFAVIFAVANVCTNIMAPRLINMEFGNFDLLLGGGIFIFSTTFFILDTVTEYFGIERAYLLILANILGLTFSCIGFSLTMHLYSNVKLPHDNPYYNLKLNYDNFYQVIIGPYYKTYLSTACASIFGYFINCYILDKLRYALNGRYLIVRLLLATSIAEILYSIVWNFIYYRGSLSLSVLEQLIGSNFVVKVVLEFFSIPFTVIIIRQLRKFEDVRLFTYKNPFLDIKSKLEQKNSN